MSIDARPVYGANAVGDGVLFKHVAVPVLRLSTVGQIAVRSINNAPIDPWVTKFDPSFPPAKRDAASRRPGQRPRRPFTRQPPTPQAPGLRKVATGSYLTAMRSVGLKLLKNKLSEYVRIAAGGETVLITDRDRVVAELVPPRAGRSPALADGVLAEAVRRGWVTPPLGGAEGPPPSIAAAPLAELVAELRADRDAR